MFSGALGLDGLYRKGMDTPYGPLAVKGRWIDDHVFEVERINVGACAQSRKWTLSFDGDKVDLSGKDLMGKLATAVGSRARVTLLRG